MDSSESAKKEYQELVKQVSPNTKIIANCFKAFFVGGIICSLGQFIMNTLTNMGYLKDQTALYTSAILVAVASLLTGLGLYGKLGKFAGAGSIVPITGFSNSISSPAIEFKKEGFVMGVGAKMFIVAGPVIVYGIAASIVVGIFYYFTK